MGFTDRMHIRKLSYYSLLELVCIRLFPFHSKYRIYWFGIIYIHSGTCVIRHSFGQENCLIRKIEMYNKTLICVQRLCRIEIVPDYTCVGLGSFPVFVFLSNVDMFIWFGQSSFGPILSLLTEAIR